MLFLRLIQDRLRILSRLSIMRVINLLLLRISFRFSQVSGRVWHAGLPFALSVEPTTQCTLRCPECPVGAGILQRARGTMDLGFFRSLVDEVSGTVFWMNLYFQGEPLLHARLPEIIAHADKMHIYTVLSTNAQQLDSEMAEKLVKSGLSRIIISLDGAKRESYEQYRRGGNFEQVLEGTRLLVAARRKLRSRIPFIQVQCLVFSHNEQEIKSVRQLALDLGADQLVLKSAQILNLLKPVMQLPEQPDYSRYLASEGTELRLKKTNSGLCYRMWSSAVITWDGLLVPCCYDKEAEYSFGSLNETSFSKRWKGSNADHFRRMVLHSRQNVPICRNCPEP
ncbi:MAG: radical SAM/SPASM domain-containing protein [Bacteroidales bacterium]